MASLEEKLHSHCKDLLDAGEKREITAFCPACKGEISTYALACPSCGFDLQEDQGTPRGKMVTFQLIGRDGADLLLSVGMILSLLAGFALLICTCVCLVRTEWTLAMGTLVGAVHSAALAVVFYRTRHL